MSDETESVENADLGSGPVRVGTMKLEPFVSRLVFPVSGFQALSRAGRTAQIAIKAFGDECAKLKPRWSEEELLSRRVKLCDVDLNNIASIISGIGYGCHILWLYTGGMVTIDNAECSGLFDSWRLVVKAKGVQ